MQTTIKPVKILKAWKKTVPSYINSNGKEEENTEENWTRQDSKIMKKNCSLLYKVPVNSNLQVVSRFLAAQPEKPRVSFDPSSGARAGEGNAAAPQERKFTRYFEGRELCDTWGGKDMIP